MKPKNPPAKPSLKSQPTPLSPTAPAIQPGTASPKSNSNPASAPLTASPEPVITPESIVQAQSRLAEAQEPRQKRKYTPRGTSKAVVPAASGETVPVSLDEAKLILNMPFDGLAKVTEFDGFKLPADKLDSCAPLMDKVMKQYLPQMEGPHAALMALSIGLGTHLAVSSFAFWQFKKEQEVEESEEVA